MQRGRTLFLLVMIMMMILSFQVAAQQYVLVLGHNAAEGTYTHEGCLVMKKVVEVLTDGNMTIEIYPTNQLGGNREMVEATGMGAQDMAIMGLGVLSYMEPRYAFLQMPYLFSSQQHLHTYIQSSTVQDMVESLKDNQNIYLISQTWDRMPRHIAGVSPVYGPEDVKGLFLRGGVEAVVEYYSLMGAETTHVGLSEMYLALQQGVIQAVELPIDYFYEYSVYEVASYLSMVEHIYGTQFVAINANTWDNLPVSYQRALRAAVAAGEAVNNAIVWEEDDKYMNLLKEAGMTVVPRYEVDYDAFVKGLEENMGALYRIWPEAEGMFEDILRYAF